MEQSKRQLQVGNLVQKELSHIIQHKFNGLVPGRLLTVTNVKMTPDLSIARISLSIFPSNDGEAIIKEINKQVSPIRFELGNALRNNLKKIPELVFYLDDSLDQSEKIDQLLKK
ncbi:MAG: 30S ribosome-binding factor RbfA [Bacteroidota bacterium]|jgi:ribosome-binding factor A|nr:30S ribosome-binding factor RbfA [Bacteroidales bacterium]MDI9535995.1 30S ribosome-binding factor RbfA [Bacteroidota bacterium]OQC45413.1 MAG: Ribosome-binding factor A [Bacteroidetes bacterium ADurb.Bin028]NLP20496.1 30S ribosome-binding factor RbfA [Bacteroidales bacterium]HNY45187.1 30S ribosome-binding factor RbfA [Bacteroidales bacterium]